MIITRVKYTKNFIKNLRKMPRGIKQLAIGKEKIFKANPLHPSLRLHELKGKLQGLWSISINKNYRIIFKRMLNGDIFFISIGNHDIYKNLKTSTI